MWTIEDGNHPDFGIYADFQRRNHAEDFWRDQGLSHSRNYRMFESGAARSSLPWQIVAMSPQTGLPEFLAGFCEQVLADQFRDDCRPVAEDWRLMRREHNGDLVMVGNTEASPDNSRMPIGWLNNEPVYEEAAQSIAHVLKVDLPAQTGEALVGLERKTGFASVEDARAYLRTHAFDIRENSAIRFAPFHELAPAFPFLIPLNPRPHNSRIWVYRLDEFYATVENANFDLGPGGLHWQIFTTIYGPGQKLGAAPVEPAQRRRAIRIV